MPIKREPSVGRFGVLQNVKPDHQKPGEFLEGGITGTANTGCKIPYVAYEQSDANDGPWEEVKPDLSVKPSSVATKEGNK
jgi:hypothetical protein